MLKRTVLATARLRTNRGWNTNVCNNRRPFSGFAAFSYGQGFLGTLGNDVEPFRDEPYPKNVQSLENLPVVTADCGWGHSAFLTEDGRIIMTGRFLDFRNTMRNINIRGGFPVLQSLMNSVANYFFHSDIAVQEFGCDENDPFIHITCSSASLSAALTRSGQLYMIGSNSFGQCGTGKVSDIVDHFTPVSLMDGSERVSCVSLGFEHATVVSDKGNIFTWGRGDRAQLGLGDKSHYRSPVRVLGENQEWLDPQSEVLFVACESGISKTAAIDSEGNLWVWGKMMSDKPGLKRGDGYVMQDQDCPRKVQFRGIHDVIHIPSRDDPLAEQEDDGMIQEEYESVRDTTMPSDTRETADLHDIETRRRARWERVMAERMLSTSVPSSVPFTRADQIPAERAIRIGPDARVAGDVPEDYSPEVVMVTAGHAHYSILTRDGRLWMIGLRGRGVLYDDSDAVAGSSVEDRGRNVAYGHGHHERDAFDASSASGEGADEPIDSQPSIPEVYSQVTPLYIPPGPLEGKEVVGLRSSLHYSYAITKDGEVYRWGWKGIVTPDPELNGLDIRFGPKQKPVQGSGRKVHVKDVNFGSFHAVGVGIIPSGDGGSSEQQLQ